MHFWLFVPDLTDLHPSIVTCPPHSVYLPCGSGTLLCISAPYPQKHLQTLSNPAHIDHLFLGPSESGKSASVDGWHATHSASVLLVSLSPTRAVGHRTPGPCSTEAGISNCCASASEIHTLSPFQCCHRGWLPLYHRRCCNHWWAYRKA